SAYIQMLVDAKILYRCQRFDLKSRKSLRGEEKYYLADPGIYFARNVDVRLNYGPSLENALYVYLRSRGYRLSVGRIGKLECDFIARRHDLYAYIQVSMTIADRDVEEREYRPFGYIKDGYPRYLFTLDPLLQRREGVRHLNMIDFMKDDEELHE
ncbi:MAG: ATP-binding protein, partial [Coriobacteriales bacterium]